MEKTETDRKFRLFIFLGIIALTLAYGAYKYHMVTTALSVWDGQVIESRPGLAAK